MKIAVISADYPGPDLLYGDTFVHARVRIYAESSDVKIFGHKATLPQDRVYTYQGIDVFISNDIHVFENAVREFNADIIAIHLANRIHIPFFLSLQKPLAVFVHGYEILSWRRRMMNYTTLGDFRYLLPFIIHNHKQLKAMRKLVRYSNENPSVRLVFVSGWLRKASIDDLGAEIRNGNVIPNGIDTSLFKPQPKDAEKRKKILLLRSFKAINYANDLSIEAILLLRKKDFFSELEFTIYGEGYLFSILTEKVKHLPNVILQNRFIENKDIPALHSQHGIFLCPSRLDTQGVSMCEAMASGLVPITTSIGGIPEYAENNKTAFLVTTPEEIAEKVEYLYHHPDVFLQMTSEASVAIENKCSLKQTVSKELALMNSMLGLKAAAQECTRCLLGTADDPNISFNSDGLCSFCQAYDLYEKESVKTDAKGHEELEKIVEKVKKEGQGKEYDCIIGLSGGVDSTYLALKAKELGLRPLAVHFDNGWNSELAVSNIENIVSKLGFELYTHVIDWEEFRDLQLAFLKASVIDIEMITDHAILTSLYQIALSKKIKYILSGVNYVTESILPPSWIHDKRDHVHIRAINEKFGKVPLKKFPLLTSMLKWRAEWFGIESLSLLNYYPYVKSEIKKEITEKLNWRDYGGKHYESVFTRFYQGYILPVKFGVDKRKAHLSNLICAGQMTKQEALEELRMPIYPPELWRKDYEFVLKKFELTEEEFKKIIDLPVKKHTDYPIERGIYERFPLLRGARPLWHKLKSLKHGV